MTPRTKLLFVLSGDHGELFNANYFLAGSGLDAVLLMPPRLLQLNAGTLTHPAHGYETVADILAAVDRARPDGVVLFSGYLFVLNRLLDLTGFEQLLAGLSERGIPVATSDPSVGLMTRVSEDSFAPAHPARDWLTVLFPVLFQKLRDRLHLYLAPGAVTDAPNASYFNPRAIPDAAGLARIREELCRWQAIDRGRARWLFVVSAEDYATQALRYGRERFEALLADRLADAAAAGRQPMLIAPSDCLARLRTGASISDDLVALSACDHARFMQVLHESEYVFYWNAFSASILVRGLAAQPYLVFDRGHLARALPAFFEVGSRHFYAGRPPEPLDPRMPLVPKDLAEHAARLERDVHPAFREHYARSPLPEEVAIRICRGEGEKAR